MTYCWTVVSNCLKLIHKWSVCGNIPGLCFSDRWLLPYTDWLPVSVVVPLPGIISDCCWLSEVDCAKHLLISISKWLGRRPNRKRAENQPWPSCLLCGSLCQVMPGFLWMTLGMSQDGWGGINCWGTGREASSSKTKQNTQQKSFTLNILCSVGNKSSEYPLAKGQFLPLSFAFFMCSFQGDKLQIFLCC